MNIQIICIGKMKEKSATTLCQEYLKRISKYAKISITELQDEKFDKILSKNDIEKIKNIECEKILEKISKITNPYVISLDLTGNTYTSEKFSKNISNIATYSSSNLVFIIGGSLGLNEKILKNSNDKMSFSTLTFPHQLIRIFLLEQIFRAFKISNNEIYHH
ncbi:MAG: 23S rRNA (pseudouridine(1915)-N(3))-methyltransferase RlmH [Clostridia bacterium]